MGQRGGPIASQAGRRPCRVTQTAGRPKAAPSKINLAGDPKATPITRTAGGPKAAPSNTNENTKERSMTIESLEVGVRVRVLGGPFAGRVGVISELDGKGGARVTLGLLSARVLLENLRPARDVDRPSLKSSHRKLPQAEGEGVRTPATRSRKTRSPRRSFGK